jgi:hypothetical protein
MFVTPWAEDQLYPSDIHINQHKGGELFGLAKWVAEDGNIDNADVVCWPCECLPPLFLLKLSSSLQASESVTLLERRTGRSCRSRSSGSTSSPPTSST